VNNNFHSRNIHIETAEITYQKQMNQSIEFPLLKNE